MLLSLLLLPAGSAWGYENGAPPGHTGGFGEPDCSMCHSDRDRNPPQGVLRVHGLPDEYTPGARYELIIELQHPELRSGGFQLTLRSAEGESAGELVSPSDRTQVVSVDDGDYLQHTGAGRLPEDQGVLRWPFLWVAAAASGAVHLHVAANAANDDLSALGDYVFTLERVLPEAAP